MYVSSFNKGTEPLCKEVKFRLCHNQLRRAREALRDALQLSKLPGLQHMSLLSDLCLLLYRCAPGCYAYVRFHQDDELELFLPRPKPRRVPC
jgi:hypothetical protein